ncbi:MAG TPA: PAS domain S-box protein, partial [Planctomycetota bacterium]|nr:PAS domain S-box protein [Planctomycetota bacterium]
MADRSEDIPGERTLRERVASLEERLRLAEARFDDAQVLSRVGSWELDLVTGRGWWSAETYRIFEADPATFEVTLESVLALVHPDDRAELETTYGASVRDRKPYELVHRIVLPDGRVKHVEERGTTRYGEDGRPLLSVGAVRDVTDRRRMEDALRLERSRLRAVLDALPDYVWLKDLGNRYVAMNGPAVRALGVTEAEVLGKTEREFFPAEFAELSEARDREAIEGRRLTIHERWFVCPSDGARVRLETVRTPFCDGGGVPAGVLGIARDVTHRWNAQEALRASEDKLRAMIELAPVGFGEGDPGTGAFLNVNRRMCEITGYGLEEL